jgi:ribosomal protein S18 acetylase RimI-like enzyme
MTNPDPATALNSMSQPIPSVTLRAATPDDRDFLLTVFAGTRADELAVLSADAAQREVFINLQFNAQQQSYSDCYPAAENSIILLAGQPIGRMIVDRATEEILLVDIALLSHYRNRRIGSSLIRSLMDEASATRKAVRLSVYKLNPALRLYQRLGFFPSADDGLYFEMKWVPAGL